MLGMVTNLIKSLLSIRRQPFRSTFILNKRSGIRLMRTLAEVTRGESAAAGLEMDGLHHVTPPKIRQRRWQMEEDIDRSLRWHDPPG
ncbi:hypothetical protein PoB_006528000 [Plakobranchus ocellatus]|uniref:Uncharacterized protein n=1 Tax=Plakobranchus ocellatus TaxID=259542 RepID=A0AAV4D463_9GAST|nr:hypothetical protein PoB_006528000 [Plakobranchus ocellatus]